MNINLETYVVSSDDQYKSAMSVRRQIFVEEQKISPDHEFDGNDHSATHILACVDGKPVGTMRIRYFKDFVKFERMCVLPQYRKFDVSEQIMQKAFRFAAQKGYDKVYGVCKKELLHRWAQNGFQPIENAPTVVQNNMTLVPIMCVLPVEENRISLLTPSEVLNAPEGTWFEQKTSSEPLCSDFRKNFQNLFAKVKHLKAESEPKAPQQISTIKPNLYQAHDKSD